jgi:hypothetical protein
MSEKKEIIKSEVAILGSPYMPQSFEGKLQLADILAKSGLTPDGLETKEQVFLALQYGAELGLSPMVSIQNISVVNKRPAFMTEIKRGLAFNTGQVADYKVEEIIGKFDTDEEEVIEVIITARRKDYDIECKGSFSLNEAKRAGLLGKNNWKYRASMLKKRADSRLFDSLFPERFAGLMSPEEAEELPMKDVTEKPIDAVDVKKIDLANVEEVVINDDSPENKEEKKDPEKAKKTDKKEAKKEGGTGKEKAKKETKVDKKTEPEIEDNNNDAPDFVLPFEQNKSLLEVLERARTIKPLMTDEEKLHFKSISDAGPDKYTLEQYEHDIEFLKKIKNKEQKDEGLFNDDLPEGVL